MCECVRACVRACVHVCVGGWGCESRVTVIKSSLYTSAE